MKLAKNRGQSCESGDEFQRAFGSVKATTESSPRLQHGDRLLEVQSKTRGVSGHVASDRVELCQQLQAGIIRTVDRWIGSESVVKEPDGLSDGPNRCRCTMERIDP